MRMRSLRFDQQKRSLRPLEFNQYQFENLMREIVLEKKELSEIEAERFLKRCWQMLERDECKNYSIKLKNKLIYSLMLSWLERQVNSVDGLEPRARTILINHCVQGKAVDTGIDKLTQRLKDYVADVQAGEKIQLERLQQRGDWPTKDAYELYQPVYEEIFQKIGRSYDMIVCTPRPRDEIEAENAVCEILTEIMSPLIKLQTVRMNNANKIIAAACQNAESEFSSVLGECATDIFEAQVATREETFVLECAARFFIEGLLTNLFRSDCQLLLITYSPIGMEIPDLDARKPAYVCAPHGLFYVNNGDQLFTKNNSIKIDNSKMTLEHLRERLKNDDSGGYASIRDLSPEAQKIITYASGHISAFSDDDKNKWLLQHRETFFQAQNQWGLAVAKNMCAKAMELYLYRISTKALSKRSYRNVFLCMNEAKEYVMSAMREIQLDGPHYATFNDFLEEPAKNELLIKDQRRVACLNEKIRKSCYSKKPLSENAQHVIKNLQNDLIAMEELNDARVEYWAVLFLLIEAYENASCNPQTNGLTFFQPTLFREELLLILKDAFKLKNLESTIGKILQEKVEKGYYANLDQAEKDQAFITKVMTGILHKKFQEGSSQELGPTQLKVLNTKLHAQITKNALPLQTVDYGPMVYSC